MTTTIKGYGITDITLTAKEGSNVYTETVSVFLYRVPTCTGFTISPPDGESGVTIFTMTVSGCEDGYGIAAGMIYTFEVEKYQNADSQSTTLETILANTASPTYVGTIEGYGQAEVIVFPKNLLNREIKLEATPAV